MLVTMESATIKGDNRMHVTFDNHASVVFCHIRAHTGSDSDKRITAAKVEPLNHRLRAPSISELSAAGSGCQDCLGFN